jgi:hypothetical protein
MDEEEHASLAAKSFTFPFISTPQLDHVVR